MDMRPINMCCYDKGVFTFCPAHCCFIPNLICFFRSNLSRLKRLAYLIGNDVVFLLSSCDMLILSFAQEKFFISCFGIAFIRTDKLTIIGFLCILGIVCTICQTLCYRFSLVNMKGNQSCCRHRFTSW